MCHKMQAENRFKVLPKSDGQFDQTELRQSVRTSALIGKSDLTRLNWLVRFAERADSIGRLAPEKLDRLADQIRSERSPALLDRFYLDLKSGLKSRMR